MAEKKSIPPPIDRPLARAYVRGFVGWCTAFPPGHTEPTSLRVMDNVWIDRNGGVAVRPGLRYLSYSVSPTSPERGEAQPGVAIQEEMIGSQEPFYLRDGSKALLFAVREKGQPKDDEIAELAEKGPIGFRALAIGDSEGLVHKLTDERIGFDTPKDDSLNFTANTTRVQYLQIDNRILAMSDAGEPARLFMVGNEKIAKVPSVIGVPDWDDKHKLIVRHPTQAWINKQTSSSSKNVLLNPSFELGMANWSVSSNGTATVVNGAGMRAGTRCVQIRSLPARTNLVPAPLNAVAVAGRGIAGWTSSSTYGKPALTKDGSYLRINDASGKGLFLAHSGKCTGVVPGRRYRVAVHHEQGANTTPIVMIGFYNSANARIGNFGKFELSATNGRHVTPSMTAPSGAVSAVVYLGGDNKATSAAFVRVKDVLLSPDTEPTDMFSGDGKGTVKSYYYWTGTVNNSASVYHPPARVVLRAANVAAVANEALVGSVHTKFSSGAIRTVSQFLQGYDKTGALVQNISSTGTGGDNAWGRTSVAISKVATNHVTTSLAIALESVSRGVVVSVDSCMIEPGKSTPSDYFDGSTAAGSGGTVTYSWADRAKPHASASLKHTKTDLTGIPPVNPATTKTLIASGGATANSYKMAFFYTFSNELGESSPSKITEVRVSRPWSNWYWETANGSAEPSGTATEDDTLCADQLAVYMPVTVYDAAVAAGAIHWNLYGFAWTDQEPVPVTATLIAKTDIYPDEPTALRSENLSHAQAGIVRVTPARSLHQEELPLPSATNRENYSEPPRTRTGLVAGDRVIAVGDPANLARIVWSANRAGNYTSFTPSQGGGRKTLTTGNINVPVNVVLWQNPQSTDTLTILCSGTDGRSSCYYMNPATISTANSGSIQVMGFEETTNTPGSVSPYAAEIINNALYRPLDETFLKSTAANYNINHTVTTDKISNMWRSLRSKQRMVSASLDNRIYLLVHNPYGAPLEPGCTGNEVWIYDVGIEGGAWSRFTVQGHNLRTMAIGVQTYMTVTRPDGLYYFDGSHLMDDYVDEEGFIRQRPIPWRMESNVQGANRAHDAWAHVHQMGISLGDFQGKLIYGLRSKDRFGMSVEITKVFQNEVRPPDDGLRWDVTDKLVIGRDLQEWKFFAQSVQGEVSYANLGYVEYRYTPISVNIGYGMGDVESFEYGRNVVDGPDSYSANGIPLPHNFATRP